MSKLDWSRVSLRVVDPARYQRTTDALARDGEARPKKKRLKKPKMSSPLRLARHVSQKADTAEAGEAHRRKKAELRALELERARLNRLAKEKRRAEATLQQAEAQRRKDEKRAAQRVAAEAKRAAFREYQKTPEYAAKVARERAEIEAKKKTHLEAWVDQLAELKGDRKDLRERWKARLLNRDRKPPVAPST